MENKKDLRMVFWVPYNISEIQKGIQAGHCALEYAEKVARDGRCVLEYGKQYIEFINDHKTWMVYNGGTTNSDEDLTITDKHRFKGSLNNIQYNLDELGIVYATFIEPDLNNALSCICCVIDYVEIDFETSLEELGESSLSYFIRTQRFA